MRSSTALPASTPSKALTACAEFGRIILFGNATGESARFNTSAMYAKALSAHGLWLTKLSANHALIRQALDSMIPYILSGQLRPTIGAKFPISAAGDALRLLLRAQKLRQGRADPLNAGTPPRPALSIFVAL